MGAQAIELPLPTLEGAGGYAREMTDDRSRGNASCSPATLLPLTPDHDSGRAGTTRTAAGEPR